MTAYSFDDVVLVPLPFTDQTGHKKRPAVAGSSAAYHQQRQDLILMAITSHSRPARTFGEVSIVDWQQAGLLQPSILKPVPPARPLVK
jgi:mRNA interferase MazF